MDLVVLVKLLHTLVFFVASGCIAYVVYCGISRKSNRRLWAAMVLVTLIGLSYAVNGFECPLASLVYRLAGRRGVADIYFPDWFARNIMPVSTIIFLLGAVLVARNRFVGRSERGP